MNLMRVFLFVIVCLATSLGMMRLFGGGPGTALMSVFALGVGYAYGTFQMMYVYKKKIQDAIKSLQEK